MVLSCKKAAALIDKKQSVGLNAVEQMQLRVHIRMCEACRTFEQQSLLLDRALGHIAGKIPGEDLHITAEAKARIFRLAKES